MQEESKNEPDKKAVEVSEDAVVNRGLIGILSDINLLASKTEVKIDNMNDRLINHMYEEDRNKDKFLSGFPGNNPKDHIYIHDKLDSFLRWQVAINVVLTISVLILAIAVIVLFMVH